MLRPIPFSSSLVPDIAQYNYLFRNIKSIINTDVAAQNRLEWWAGNKELVNVGQTNFVISHFCYPLYSSQRQNEVFISFFQSQLFSQLL